MRKTVAAEQSLSHPQEDAPHTKRRPREALKVENPLIFAVVEVLCVHGARVVEIRLHRRVGDVVEELVAPFERPRVHPRGLAVADILTIRDQALRVPATIVVQAGMRAMLGSK